jgi:hypothetical protein
MSAFKRTSDLQKAIQITKEKGNTAKEIVESCLGALAEQGITTLDMAKEYIVAAQLGHAHSNEFDDGVIRSRGKAKSRPDAYTSTGKYVEYKGTKHCDALTKTYKGKNKDVLTKAGQKLKIENKLDFYATFNSINSEDKILDYLDWDIVSYVHKNGKVLAIATLPSEQVVEQLLEVYVEKQNKRKMGKRVHDNLNTAKCEVLVSELVYRNF